MIRSSKKLGRLCWLPLRRYSPFSNFSSFSTPDTFRLVIDIDSDDDETVVTDDDSLPSLSDDEEQAHSAPCTPRPSTPPTIFLTFPTPQKPGLHSHLLPMELWSPYADIVPPRVTSPLARFAAAV